MVIERKERSWNRDTPRKQLGVEFGGERIL